MHDLGDQPLIPAGLRQGCKLAAVCRGARAQRMHEAVACCERSSSEHFLSFRDAGEVLWFLGTR